MFWHSAGTCTVDVGGRGAKRLRLRLRLRPGSGQWPTTYTRKPCAESQDIGIQEQARVEEPRWIKTKGEGCGRWDFRRGVRNDGGSKDAGNRPVRDPRL